MTMTKNVTFAAAMTALEAGKVVYREGWEGTDGRTKLVGFKLDTTNIKEYPDAERYIVANLWNGREVMWIAYPTDMGATDWVIE